MTTFIEIEQDGLTAYINPDHVVLVTQGLVGRSSLITINGLNIGVTGTTQEILAKLEGRNILTESC